MAILLSGEAGELSGRTLPHKTWTRDEIKVLESTGLFDGTHYELIDGELIDKMGKNRPHVKGTRNIVRTLEKVFGADHVEQEAPVDVAAGDRARNEPEPDVTVVRRPTAEIDTAPLPSEVALVVEVADSTLWHDTNVKAALYARAGFPEYWVLDIKGRKLHVLRDPAEGVYRTHLEFDESGSVRPLAKPDCAVSVASLLP